jgi:hypothetical protein
VRASWSGKEILIQPLSFSTQIKMKSPSGEREVSSIVIDRNDRIWATTISHGIIVLGKNRSLLKHNFKYYTR